MTVLTLAGSLIMSAILSEARFMLNLDQFFGVKLSYVVPLAFVPCVLWLRENNWYSLLRGTAKNSVRFWQLGVAFILLAALALYILRSGNEGLGTVSDLERSFRNMLNNTLGARPRTTEFLIGHPLMMMLLYYGYRFNMFPLLMAGIMGQVSLINTYAHFHTPLRLSLLRSFHGLWIGILIGIILIGVLELVFRRVRKLEKKYGEKNGEGIEIESA
jgi:hypothetical protein